MELATSNMRKEIVATYDLLVSAEGFPNLSALTAFCRAHPHAQGSEHSNDEYNFYFEREQCFYWLRCFTTQNEHNMYLNAFLKTNENNGRDGE